MGGIYNYIFVYNIHACVAVILYGLPVMWTLHVVNVCVELACALVLLVSFWDSLNTIKKVA